MAQPLFSPIEQNTIDGYNDPNIPIVKPMALRNGVSGASFKHFLLPENSGGTVAISNNIGSDDSRQYNTSENILPHMALIYNAHGGVVTPNFGEASDLNNPFNFAGIALTSVLIGNENWQQRMVIIAPPARARSAMAFNQLTSTSVLFGGVSNSFSSLYNDTWEWDGISWTQKTPFTSPTLRARHEMVYDSGNNFIVLYGGVGNSGQLDDTWVWDGSNWTLAQAHSPGGLNTRQLHAMAYDSNRQKTVLFGGFHISDNNDTWEWNNVTWTLVVTASSPTARVLHAMTYDVNRRLVILFGGTVNAGNTIYGDTWEYDGVDWVQNIVPGPNPPARFMAKIVYNTSKKVSTLFGGFDINFVPFNDTWEYDGITWTQIDAVAPATRAGHSMDYDIVRDKLVVFGGTDQTDTNVKGDTWELGRAQKPALVQAHGDGYVFYDASVGRPTPVIGDFFGPGAVIGTVTSTIIPPIFGYAVGVPVIDPLTSLPLQLTINGSPVGLIKMRVEAFYGFLTIPPPSLVNFTPTFGPVGTIVTINGTSFLATTQVSFDGGTPVNAVYTIVSNIQLLVTVPAVAQTGTITVTTGAGSNTSVGTFTVLPIIISVIAPLHSIGSSITITGHTFTPTISVNFNGTPSIYSVVDDATITATIPNGATTGPITVVTVDGTATFLDFIIIALPVINNNGLAPLQGPVGSFVSITGSGFSASGAGGDGLGILQFRNVGLAQTFVAQRTIFSDSQMSAIVPDPGTSQGSIAYTLRFITDGGQVDSAQSYTIIPTPKFLTNNSFSPTQGAPGTLVTISGAWGFTGLVSVSFGNFNASTINFINDTTITAVVPIIPSLVDPNVGIRVVAGGGTRNTTDVGPSTSPSTFTILLQPSISSFSPISGGVNTSVIIAGNNLLTVDHVFFATATSSDGYTVRAGSVVTVTTDEEHGFNDGDNVLVASTDNDFPSGYFTIILQDAFTIQYTQAGAAVSNTSPIHFGDASITTSFIVNSNTQITAVVPFKQTGLTNEPIIVSSGIATPLFAVSSTSYTYIPRPSISSLNKTSGGFGTPPTQVSIFGDNLLWNIGNNPSTGNTNPTVKFGNIVAPIVSANSTTVIVTVPNGATDGITLITDGGSDGYTFSVVQPPIVYYSTPTSGQTNFGGTNVSIVGNNFVQSYGTTTVSFFHSLFFTVTPLSIVNGKIVVNTAQLDVHVDPINGTVFTIYVTVSYDSGNGKYQVNSPNTYFGFDNIS